MKQSTFLQLTDLIAPVARPGFARVFIAAALLSTAGAQAVEYSLDSALQVTAQHDDNIRLSVDNQESVYGHSINPSAKAQVRAENWQMAADLELRFSEFSDEGYDSDDQYLTLNGESRGEQYTAGFTGKVTHDTTRTSETGDSGRVSNDRRKLYSISPYWQYFVTPNQLVAINGSAQKVDYEDENYTGYEYYSGSAQWTYLYNERLRLNANINTTQYQSDGLTNDYILGLFVDSNFIPLRQEQQAYFTDTKGVGYQIGFQYQLTEALSFDGMWGKRDSETSYKIVDPSGVCNTGLIGGVCGLEDNDAKTDQKNISATWDREYNKFTASYSLDTSPSSDGYVLEQETYRLKWDYRLFERGKVSLDTTYGENEALGGSSLQNRSLSSERDYWNATLRYSHQVLEHWYVNASVRYRYQDRAVDQADTEALGGQIGIEYRPTKIIW